MESSSNFSLLRDDWNLRERRWEDPGLILYLVVQLDVVEENFEEDIGHSDERMVLLKNEV